MDDEATVSVRDVELTKRNLTKTKRKIYDKKWLLCVLFLVITLVLIGSLLLPAILNSSPPPPLNKINWNHHTEDHLPKRLEKQIDLLIEQNRRLQEQNLILLEQLKQTLTKPEYRHQS
ncbi:hypothetical protein M3Y98_00696900 [Aphelenchoides besseyi]|nr:hypothetical protein M3Y98_00696900 [Aphelenchoides besseyi]KAI6208934.1 hypothetical protein M3Y96_00167500 [Aphelenchoides besseyi]